MQASGPSSVGAATLRSRLPGRGKIFVQIPAYRDTELAATLLDLYSKAARPGQLRVSVLWQRGPHERLPPNVIKLPHLNLISVPFEKSKGCNWARSEVQQCWRGEEFSLLIDSHHRFVRGWDETLIEMHGTLVASGSARPMITAYMPRYQPQTDPQGRQNRPYKIYPRAYEDALLIHLTSYPLPRWSELKSPAPAQFVSGHFIFAAGDCNRHLRMDPGLYFTGDETALSVRAYTHGYDLFHPHVVIGWHCYDRSSRIPHWEHDSNWWKRHQSALRRLRRLFTNKLSGPFGLGNRRTIRSFEDRMLMPLIERRR
jgi:hypothetical protein